MSQISFDDSIDPVNRTDLNDLLKNQNDPVLKFISVKISSV